MITKLLDGYDRFLNNTEGFKRGRFIVLSENNIVFEDDDTYLRYPVTSDMVEIANEYQYLKVPIGDLNRFAGESVIGRMTI